MNELLIEGLDWEPPNSEFSQLVLRSFNPDLFSLNETHITGQYTIELDGYTWFGQNRKTHIRACRGSGGAGFLVKNTILFQYDVILVDKCNNGIICA